MSAYLVITPKNPEYSGKAFGVQFNNGRAIVSKDTISPHLGYTVEQIVKSMERDFGYEVRPLGGEVHYQHEAVIATGVIDMGATEKVEVAEPAPAPVATAAEKPKRNAKRRRKGAEVQESASA